MYLLRYSVFVSHPLNSSGQKRFSHWLNSYQKMPREEKTKTQKNKFSKTGSERNTKSIRAIS